MLPNGHPKWHVRQQTGRTDTGEITATFTVAPDSGWFSGHFPEAPILPGIAQLAMVYDAIQAVSKDHSGISGVRQVRFKQMIRPGDTITLKVSPRKENPKSYGFQIMAQGGLACKGTLLTV